MSELPTIVKDLALILMIAGVATLLMKRLKQPLILGYIVAGFLCGPHLSIFPSVADAERVSVWADIGVVFLMFTLGLEFSFRKLVRMGPGPVVAACTIIFCMIGLGSVAGHFFGWSKMNSLFLGGMLAMSSTTVIFKALDDMGLRQQKFASSVLGALVVEDILGILLMVILSTMAVSNQLEGRELVNSLLRLALVLVVWFIVGIFLIPTLLRKARPLMSRETLLIVSLGLCFMMVVVAVSSGYSAAFGAFIMGSILAETIEADKINEVVAPVKDLFGAIFFVSVGMLVDPAVIIDFWVPIVVLVLLIMVGQAVFGTMGFLLSGQSLRVAMQCGFSMAQIGEFAFIIASLGVSLGVTEGFLYPVVVAVSVITTFFTPYMIKLAPTVYGRVQRLLPQRLRQAVRTEHSVAAAGSDNVWRRLAGTLLKQTVAYGFLCIAILTICLSWLLPLCHRLLGHWPGNAVCGVVTFGAMSVFLRAIVMRKNHSDDFRALWAASIYNRPPLVFTILVRYVIASAFVFYLINYLSPFSSLLHWVVAFVLVGCTLMSHRIQVSSKGLEDLFLKNLKSRELHAQRTGQAAPSYAARLLSHDIHLAIVELPMNTRLAGRSLREMDLANKAGVQVAAIVRSGRRIHIPGGETVLFPGDRLQIIGSDEDIKVFSQVVQSEVFPITAYVDERDLVLRSLTVNTRSVLCNKAVRHCRLREDYDCMLVGFEDESGQIALPDADRVIKEGDTLWIVGEKRNMIEH
ncbi:MAG: cation:proton antiporter [Bacteroidaceae bacterium]|nr:cation:proton antiporter [Bacteroidaceae bacterium]MBR3633538.1 cation:proton antiporter [Bacteroidaceae bacterium]MBR6714593.1 cation:proton antiporter [Bacteroidaceae bacterium]